MKPTISMSTKKLDMCQATESKWDEAIIAAENEIESLTKQAERLRGAIKTFKSNKRDGIPWPGQQQKSPQEGANEVTR